MNDLGRTPCPTGCGRFTPGPFVLMCRTCWFLEPPQLRGRVNRTWKARLADPRDPDKRAAHEDAKAAAIASVP